MGRHILDDESGSTQESLQYWERNRVKLGNIQKARCQKEGHLEVEGSLGVMQLRGLTCGYGGQGPQGTAEVLRDIGVPAEEAEELMGQIAFEVLVQCCREGD